MTTVGGKIPAILEVAGHCRDRPCAAHRLEGAAHKYSSAPGARRAKDSRNTHPPFRENGNKAGTSIPPAGDPLQKECGPGTSETMHATNRAAVRAPMRAR